MHIQGVKNLEGHQQNFHIFLLRANCSSQHMVTFIFLMKQLLTLQNMCRVLHKGQTLRSILNKGLEYFGPSSLNSTGLYRQTVCSTSSLFKRGTLQRMLRLAHVNSVLDNCSNFHKNTAAHFNSSLIFILSVTSHNTIINILQYTFSVYDRAYYNKFLKMHMYKMTLY